MACTVPAQPLCQSLLAGTRTCRGSALVIVLAFLVLMSGIILAYFSIATDQRKVSKASAAITMTSLAADAAGETIIGDLLGEIEAGSKPDFLADADPQIGIRATPPVTVTTAAPARSIAPSMVPQLVASDAINIVKKSRSGLPFFTADGWYGPFPSPKPAPSPGPIRASSVSTSAPSLNGRSIVPARWAFPGLMTTSEAAAFVAPDWIYVDRDGKNPTDFSSSILAQLKSPDLSNRTFVIGRFAYVIYDLGGLIDINIVGNALVSVENARRGRLNQVSLTEGIAGIPIPEFQNFVNWRSAVNKSNSDATAGGGGLFDPKLTNLETVSGNEAFLNRQDLIRYVNRAASPIPSSALPYLTTFSRELNAPSFQPDPLRSKLPVSPTADAMNPGLLSVRFPEETVLSRGGSDEVTVPAGTSVMPRRFPLSKLDLLVESNPDASELEYYFGLRKRPADGVFEYIAGIGNLTNGYRIARLSEVVADGREPNFFEVLQSVLYTGSLGTSGLDAYTRNSGRDAAQNLQVIQIGANIIDQWDADDIPTTIEYPAANLVLGAPPTPQPQPPYEFFGIENLPYLNQIAISGYRPSYKPDSLQVWAVFDFWNPHQNAKTPPSGISEFRVKPVSGRSYLDMYYQLGDPPYNDLRIQTWRATPSQSIIALNPEPFLTFSAAADYSEPLTIGSPPNSASAMAGLLMIDNTLPMAIPPVGLRPPALQAAIDASGFAFGVKAHNTFRLWPDASNSYSFDVQAKINGTWRTYQQLEDLYSPSDRLFNQMHGETTGQTTVGTHHTVASPSTMLTNGFYTWRSPGSVNSLMRTDPRTGRFGLIGVGGQNDGGDILGVSLRTDPGVWNGTAFDAATLKKWVINAGNSTPGGPGFEKATPRFAPYGMVANNPEVLNTTFPMRYSDPDGVVRPADGFFGALPTIPARFADRPLILNRRFRTVGELGYAFRDAPWKTLDFATRRSGDLGLLDVFSLDETDGATPLVAGKLSINSRQSAVIEIVLRGASKSLPGINSAVSAAELTSLESRTIADAIVSESKSRPFFSKGDLVTRVMNSPSASSPISDTVKTQREAGVRALAEIGSTRMWNLLIDVIAQTGRFTPSSQSGGNFFVQGEQRLWIHVAIDRMTGRVVEMRQEVVNE